MLDPPGGCPAGGGGLGEGEGAGDISSTLPYTALPHGASPKRDFAQSRVSVTHVSLNPEAPLPCKVVHKEEYHEYLKLSHLTAGLREILTTVPFLYRAGHVRRDASVHGSLPPVPTEAPHNTAEPRKSGRGGGGGGGGI